MLYLFSILNTHTYDNSTCIIACIIAETEYHCGHNNLIKFVLP